MPRCHPPQVAGTVPGALSCSCGQGADCLHVQFIEHHWVDMQQRGDLQHASVACAVALQRRPLGTQRTMWYCADGGELVQHVTRTGRLKCDCSAGQSGECEHKGQVRQLLYEQVGVEGAVDEAAAAAAADWADDDASSSDDEADGRPRHSYTYPPAPEVQRRMQELAKQPPPKCLQPERPPPGEWMCQCGLDYCGGAYSPGTTARLHLSHPHGSYVCIVKDLVCPAGKCVLRYDPMANALFAVSSETFVAVK